MLSAKSKVHEIDAEYDHQSKLIQKAKAEWTKRNMPKESKTEGGGSKYSSLLFPFWAEDIGGLEVLGEGGGRKSASAAAAESPEMRVVREFVRNCRREWGKYKLDE